MKLSLGKWLYKYYFQPTLKYRYNITHFGLLGWFKMHRGEKAMKRAALKLNPITLLENPLLEVSYLTGKNYWHQTIFCAYSLAKALHGRVKINIYSDGSLSEQQNTAIRHVLANVCIIENKTIELQIEQILPKQKFPTLNYLRSENAFFRKLVDMRINDGYIIQLDSDMLFFSRPDMLVNAFKTELFFYMQDTIDSSFYVIPEEKISSQLGITVKPKINSGILAYNSSKIDWIFIEKTCEYLLANIRSIHPPMLEQTINAIIISMLKGNALDGSYKILYNSDCDNLEESDVVRHYIYKAKYRYLTQEWKKIAH